MILPLTVKREAPGHSLILDAQGKWIATVSTEGDADRAEFIRQQLEARSAAGAKTNKESK